MERPSLHDLANATGFGSGLKGIRQHYDPCWGLSGADPKPFKVRIDYSYSVRGSVTYEVEAADEDAAQKIAEEKFDKDGSIDGDLIEIDNITIKLGHK